MSNKWKYFLKKYQNFCIVSGIAGFLLAPFLWPFFLAILVNTLSLTVPILLVYLAICRLKKKPEEVKREKSTEDSQSGKQQAKRDEEKTMKREKPIVQTSRQEQTAGKKMQKERETCVSKERNEVDKAARDWYIMGGREKIHRISMKLAAEGINSFSIGKDGLCSIRTEKGFCRVAAIRDFPAQKILTIKKELEKEGTYYVKLSVRYMWITRR